MSTLTLTPSRFGTSFSAGRDVYNPTAPSMAESLPSVDFDFNDLRERMNQFTARFDEFIERGRKRVLEEHNAFKINVAEMKEAQRARKAEIAQLESKSSSHAHTLAKEAAEADEMAAAMRALSERKDQHVARRDQLRADIDSAHVVVRARREAQAAHQRALELQARHNVPELHFWERCLGLRIEASGLGVADQLRFVFTSVDKRDDGREAWFELNMGGKDYKVAGARPELDVEAVTGLVNRLNDGRELGPFLKSMRALLVEKMKL